MTEHPRCLIQWRRPAPLHGIRRSCRPPVGAAAVLFAVMIGNTSRAADTPPSRASDRSSLCGSVEGTVYYRGDTQHRWRYARYYVKNARSGELAETVIALEGSNLKKLRAAGDDRIATIDQREMRFVPETVAIRAGSRVRFTNSDPQTHNVSTADPRRRFSETIANGKEAVVTFARGTGVRLPFAIGCSIHSQMQGWIYVFDHPYFQITGADGRFRLDNVPAGKYRLDAAHPAGNLLASRTVTVQCGDVTRVDLILTPQNRLAEN